MQPKHLFKKYFATSVLFILGVGIGLYIFFTLDAAFRIQQVVIFGASKQEQITITNLFKGVSTFSLQTSDIKRILLMRFPTMQIKASSIVLPHTLKLEVEDIKPIANLKTDFGYLSLSTNGIVVSKERSESVPNPSITFYQTVHHSEYQTGQHIGFTAVERALTFIALLSDEGYQTETVAIDSVDMIACKTKGFEVAFSQTRPIELQVHEVRQIIRQIKAGALRIGRLDLRFDKPVVQLPKK